MHVACILRMENSSSYMKHHVCSPKLMRFKVSELCLMPETERDISKWRNWQIQKDINLYLLVVYSLLFYRNIFKNLLF